MNGRLGSWPGRGLTRSRRRRQYGDRNAGRKADLALGSAPTGTTSIVTAAARWQRSPLPAATAERAGRQRRIGYRSATTPGQRHRGCTPSSKRGRARPARPLAVERQKDWPSATDRHRTVVPSPQQSPGQDAGHRSPHCSMATEATTMAAAPATTISRPWRNSPTLPVATMSRHRQPSARRTATDGRPPSGESDQIHRGSAMANPRTSRAAAAEPISNALRTGMVR